MAAPPHSLPPPFILRHPARPHRRFSASAKTDQHGSDLCRFGSRASPSWTEFSLSSGRACFSGSPAERVSFLMRRALSGLLLYYMFAFALTIANQIFFTVMFITTVGTKKVHECRNFWNSNLGGPLLVKIFILLSCLYLVQVPPTAFIQLYGNIARAGAWLFLVIQLVSLTRFFMMLNIMQESITNRWRWLVQAVTIIANLGSFGAILWLLRGHTSDLVDLTIVGVTIMLMLLMIIIHFKTQATTSWLAPGLMLSYIVFMCWIVIISEPHRESTKAKDPKGPDWLTYMSLFFMAFSALSTGVDDWIQFNDEEPSEDNIPYGFGYFHLVFALGSMYFGMIIVGWNAHQTMERWTIDVGWWSAVVRAANGVLAAVLYTWMLRTPFIWSKTKLVLSWPEASWIPHVTFL